MTNKKPSGDKNSTNTNDFPNGFPGGFCTYTITSTVDPNILHCLPPELREMIEKDVMKGDDGKKGKLNNEDQEEVKRPKIKYDFKMTNVNQDLEDLTKKLKKSKVYNYGLLLYGQSGSGKSYYGEYLAQELGMPFIKKRASDLMDKYVGQTEGNIQAAFQEARKKKAILLFDEADSFLFDRKYAKQEFNVSSVNELLTQMEDHPYPFIMTTNLKDKIDNASLRRFIFKIKFDYMTKDNIKAGIKTYFGKGFKLKDSELDTLKYICAGDFKVAKRKLDILEGGKYTNELIYKYLKKEQDEKEIDEGSKEIEF